MLYTSCCTRVCHVGIIFTLTIIMIIIIMIIIIIIIIIRAGND